MVETSFRTCAIYPREGRRQLGEGVNDQAGARGIRAPGVQNAPRSPDQEHRKHAGLARRKDVVVQPVAYIGDLGGRQGGRAAISAIFAKNRGDGFSMAQRADDAR